MVNAFIQYNQLLRAILRKQNESRQQCQYKNGV
jgi:hypothetical protein